MKIELLPLKDHDYAAVVGKECLGEISRNGTGYNWTSYKTLHTGHTPTIPKAIQQLSRIASIYGSFRAVAALPNGNTLCFGQAPVMELGKARRYFERLLSPIPFYYIIWYKAGKKIQVYHRVQQAWIDLL